MILIWEVFDPKLWHNGTSGWLLNFIRVFNFVSSVKEFDQIKLRSVDLVVCSFIRNILWLHSFVAFLLFLSHLDFQSVKLQAKGHYGSSNINEVIKTVLNFLLFFTKRFYTHQKAQKSTKAQKCYQAKVQNANKRTKIKNA